MPGKKKEKPKKTRKGGGYQVMPKEKGYHGVNSPKGASGNTVKKDRAPNASGNMPSMKTKNSSGNTFPGANLKGKP